MTSVSCDDDFGVPDAEYWCFLDESGTPDYDPDTTTQAQRLERKSRELAAREVAHCSVPTLRRQLRHIRRGGIDALIHGNRKLHTRRLEGVSDHALTVITEALRKEPDRARISERRGSGPWKSSGRQNR